MNILIDTNVVLDFLLQREPFFQNAERLFQAISNGQVVGYVTATTLTDIFYIARRQTQSLDKAKQAVSEMLTAMVICPVDIFSAVAQGLDAIVTRNAKDFSGSTLPIYSPTDLLDQLTASNP